MNVLIVDDRMENRYLLESLFKGNGHTAVSSANGAEAFERLQKERFDLIISDILMPVMDGFQLCRKIRAEETLQHVPFIFYTATYTGPQDEELARKIGADRFVIKPCEPDVLLQIVKEVIEAADINKEKSPSHPPKEEEILKLYSERLVRKLEQKMLEAEKELVARQAAEEALRERTVELKEALIGSISAMSGIVEKRDPYTAGHQIRVAKLAKAIATELGFPPEKIEGIYLAGIIHDIGKISVPAEILAKPGKLSEQEYALIRLHPQSGYEILRPIRFPWPIAEIALRHHERLDGTGYPHNLVGDAILFEARILAVADVVEAMSSHRPYRPALGIDRALAEIRAEKGRLYDPTVVEICLRLFEEKQFSLDV
ncbi:MAG TPA: response regulator [bacterium]|nr:response regulator [bacterium]